MTDMETIIDRCTIRGVGSLLNFLELSRRHGDWVWSLDDSRRKTIRPDIASRLDSLRKICNEFRLRLDVTEDPT